MVVVIKLLTTVEVVALFIGLARARADKYLASWPLVFAPTK